MNISLSSTMKAALKLGILCLFKLKHSAEATCDSDAPTINILDLLNSQLARDGEGYQIESVGLYADEEHAEMGRLIYASDRGNKQLGSHWVPNDPRRSWSTPGSSISFVTDSPDGDTGTGLSSADTDVAIRAAMKTWNDVTCSHIPLDDGGSAPFDIGFVQWLLGAGGRPFLYADITHGGFLPASFFNQIARNGGNWILGVTFTFVFVDTNGPTDVDSNGKDDVAFREIYYNDRFPWNIGANYDVETVALHEAGHALSQGHFGDIFRNPEGKLRFAPYAVMNAAYSRVQQELTGTDEAGHCSIWASWPNN